MGRGRRAGLRCRPSPFLPAARGGDRRGRDLRRRFVHHAGGRKGMAVRSGRAGRRPAARALRAAGIPVPQPLYGQQHNPVRQIIRHRENRYQPSGDAARYRGVPVRDHHLPADRAPHRRRHVPVPALPVRAAAGVLPARSHRSSPPSAPWSTSAGRRSSRRATPSRPGCWSPNGSGGLLYRAGRCTRWGFPGTGDRTATRLATPPTSWRTSRWTRTCTSRRSRRWRATSALGGGLGAPPCATSCGRTSSGPASPRDWDGDVRWTSNRPLSSGPSGNRPRPGRAGRPFRAPAADGILHRHFGVHRLQGLRGRLQGMERRARGRAPADRHVIRQHRGLSASTWRHVAFIEQPPADGDHDVRWLMSSDVCKHCTEAACSCSPGTAVRRGRPRDAVGPDHAGQEVRRLGGCG